MKTKILILLCCGFLSSCGEKFNSDREQFGFTFLITNNSGIEHENAKITIGGIKDGEFIETDFFIFPKLLLPKYTNYSQHIGHYEDRWQPNLDLVRAISDTAYFSLQLEGKPAVLLHDYEGEIVKLPIPQGTIISSWTGGDIISVSIEENTIFGTVSEQ